MRMRQFAHLIGTAEIYKHPRMRQVAHPPGIVQTRMRQLAHPSKTFSIVYALRIPPRPSGAC